MRTGSTLLDPADVQGAGSEVDLIPVGGRSARKPVGRAGRRRGLWGVPEAPAVALCRLHEPFDLGEVLPPPQVGVARPHPVICITLSADREVHRKAGWASANSTPAEALCGRSCLGRQQLWACPGHARPRAWPRRRSGTRPGAAARPWSCRRRSSCRPRGAVRPWSV